MQNKKALFLLIGILIFGYQITSLHAQNTNTVSGVVTDASSGESLPGVNIVIGGTAIGTSTDLEGNYSLQVNSLQDTLVFSFIGYQTQRIPINGRNEIDVTMTQQLFEGSEVMVVGYGTQVREKVTGSVSQVEGTTIEAVPTANVSNSLAGRLPGLTAVATSGEPGNDESNLRIRGTATLNNSQPLVVIDGVPGRRGGLNRLDPNNIESIDIIKGASAAIYGSQAANGVILVTTKRGQAGPAQFDFSFERGFQQPSRTPKLAGSVDYMQMLNEINAVQGRPPVFSEEEINCEPNPYTCVNTDWFDVALKDWAPQTKVDMSVSGGNENTVYRISANGLVQPGQFRRGNTQFNQVNLRSNLDTDVTENFKVRLDLNGRLEDQKFPAINNESSFQSLMQAKPNLPALLPGNNLNGVIGPPVNNGNQPIAGSSPASGRDRTQTWFLQSTLTMELDVPKIEGLTLNGSVSFDKSFAERKFFAKPIEVNNFIGFDENGEAILSSSETVFSEPQLTQRFDETEDILVHGDVKYNLDLEDHHFEFLAGGEWQQFRSNFFSAFRRFFPTSQIQQLFAGGDAEKDNDGNAVEARRLTAFSRINYDFQDKYLVELIGRVDGSFIFAEGNRYGFFPAVSAAYRISEENWFQDYTGEFFDEFKIRGSWGRSGNDRIEPFQFLQTFNFTEGAIFNETEIVPGVAPTELPNEDVSWEVSTKRDIGFNARILENRLSFEFGYFWNQRKDILSFRNASIPQSAGFSLPRENIGRVSSKGYEAAIDYQQTVSDDFTFGINGNISWNTNRVDFFDEPPGGPEQQFQTGERLGAPLIFLTDGIFRSEQEITDNPSYPGAVPGDLIFKDVNGDGVINDDDQVRADKNGEPKWTGGVTVRGTFRNFDFNFFFQGQAGAHANFFRPGGSIGNFFDVYANNRFSPDNPDGTFPRAGERTDPFWADNSNNDFFFRDTHVIRLKSVDLGYTIPGTQKYGLDQVRIYWRGFNLATFFDDFDDLGLDPETVSQSTDPTQGSLGSAGRSGALYPNTTVISTGIEISF